MKIFVLAITMLLATKSWGQTALHKKFSNQTCECLVTVPNCTFDSVSSCMEKSMNASLSDMQAYVLQSGKGATYKTGKILGEKMTEQAFVNMVETCDVFYHLADTARYEDFKGADADTIKVVLDLLVAAIPKQPSGEYYAKRGTMYMMAFDYAAAASDFGNCYKLDKTLVNYLYLKALAEEALKQYDEATLTYGILIPKSPQPAYKMSLAIVKRKKSGR